MLIDQPTSNPSSYILSRDSQGQLRSKKPQKRSAPWELVGDLITSYSSMSRAPVLPQNRLSLISTAGDGPTVSRRGPYRINFCDATGTDSDALSLKQLHFPKLSLIRVTHRLPSSSLLRLTQTCCHKQVRFHWTTIFNLFLSHELQ